MITLQRAENIEEFDWILKDPEIFERIAEDGIDAEYYQVDLPDRNCYMIIKDDDKTIGVWCLYPANASTLNIHANILKEHRKHAKEAARLVLNWFADHSPDQYVKLNAEIPVIYEDVYTYTKSFGFIDEGINRLSIMKKGQLIDQHLLGLTRNEAKKLYGGDLSQK